MSTKPVKKKQKKALQAKPTLITMSASPIATAVAQATNGVAKQDIYDLQFGSQELEQSWEDLDALYDSLAEAITTISTEVSSALKRLTEASVEISKEAAIASKTLYSDLVSLANDMAVIKEGHAGKVGKVKNDIELANLLDVYNQYFLCFDRLKGLTFNPLVEITEQLMVAQKKEDEVLASVEVDVPSTST